MLAVILLPILLTSGCASKEQQLKDRQTLLENFARRLTEHLMDRNPATIKESIAQLVWEIDEKTLEKLQEVDAVPDAGLDTLKIIQHAEKNKTKNKIVVTSVKELGPVGEDVVPVEVSGQNIEQTEGKPDKIDPFTITMQLKLTKEMSGYPRAIDVSGLGKSQPKKAEPAEAGGDKKKKRRH